MKPTTVREKNKLEISTRSDASKRTPSRSASFALAANLMLDQS
jgi:hypothetical protein